MILALRYVSASLSEFDLGLTRNKPGGINEDYTGCSWIINFLALHSLPWIFPGDRGPISLWAYRFCHCLSAKR